ncbi:MAG TPA: pyridoxal-phosphate dependent enzyme [Bacteroidales bacterium]|nr:pyridoxal-phosphate dependent enzyme [Bacteroidales bacterium]HSA42737.1 pyridoxal-phosphate dependent enzyme [Bacteroidales bacterium]
MNEIPGREDIERAHHLIAPYIHNTPVLTSQSFDSLTGCNVFFKCENFQKAGAFKSRGAVHAVMTLPGESTRAGVATHSSGNHAQALARAASLRKIPAYVVMPSNAPAVKVRAVEQYGGQITFCEPSLAARESTLAGLITRTGASEIHPYNDYRIIAGQATAALEFIRQVPDLDIIIVPVGGGGLLSGSLLSCRYWSPKTAVIAAEPEKANDAYLSFRERKFVPSVNPDTIADGLKTSLGSLTFPIIMQYVHDILTTGEGAIIHATRWIWERMKIVIEPSAAVPVAVLLENAQRMSGKRIGIIISGGNADLHKLLWNQP